MKPLLQLTIISLLIILFPASSDKTIAQTQNEWTTITPPVLPGESITAIHADNTQLLVAVTGAASSAKLFRSADAGDTWVPEPAAITGVSFVESLVQMNGILLAGGHGRVSRSEDGGRTWVLSDTGIAFPDGSEPALIRNVRKLVVSGNTVYATTEAVNNQGQIIGTALYVSRDSGRNWALANKDLIVTSPVAVDGGVIFISRDLKLFLLDNNLTTPAQIETSLADILSNDTVLFSHAGSLFLGGGLTAQQTTALFRSSDGGKNWVSADAGIFDICYSFPTTILDFFSDGTRLFASGSHYCAGAPNTPGLYVSLNNGASWEKVSVPVGASRYAGIGPFAGARDYIFLWATLLGDKKLSRRRNDFAASPWPYFTTTSAASYRQYDTARGSIAAGFGVNLANSTLAAASLPIPQSLGGVSVIVKDAQNVERAAPLFFVSPSQINYLIPEDTAPGSATIFVKNGNAIVAAGQAMIVNTAPALFTANASGRDLPAALILRVRADGSQSYEPVAQFDAAQNKVVPAPIDFGAESDQVFLILFGTGIRNFSLSAVSVVSPSISASLAEVVYAGPAPGYVGLDQVNLRLARNQISGRDAEVYLRTDNRDSNMVRISFK